VELWARCLAHCEGTKPSVYSSVSNHLSKAQVNRHAIVKFVFVIEIGELLKVDFVAKDGANTTETYDDISFIIPN
jgi:hypothetical protein